MMATDTTWPCRCPDCCPPLDDCDVCGVTAGQVCAEGCSEHPLRRAPCRAMAASADYVHRIARGDTV